MAITRAQTDVTWDTGSYSNSLAAATGEASDVTSLNATCIQASITVKADNNGTPAAGDTLEVWLLASAGDPDAASPGTIEYPTDRDDGQFIGLMDVSAASKDPVRSTFPLPVVPYRFKIYCYNNASSNGITHSAVIEEMRA